MTQIACSLHSTGVQRGVAVEQPPPGHVSGFGLPTVSGRVNMTYHVACRPCQPEASRSSQKPSWPASPERCRELSRSCACSCSS